MMTEEQIVSNLPIPPGEYLEEVLEELGMSKGELAKRMDRPRPKLSAIFNGTKAITPDTAIELERATEVPAHIWTGLETEYRLAQARQREEERKKACAKETQWVTRFCYASLKKIGMVEAVTRPVDKVVALQNFFGVMSLNNVQELPRYQVVFRHGAKKVDDRSPDAVAAWLRVGETIAKQRTCAPFDKDMLRASLAELRPMTAMPPDQFLEQLKTILSQAGVALVFCPHFPKTKAHGATFFLTPQKAVLMVTLRYKWSDIFWFTLFHEIGHLLLHSPKEVILENAEKTKIEHEADIFARDALIPLPAWKRFLEQNRFNDQNIKQFAKDQNIAPGIIIGRLQYDKVIPQNFGNHLRTQYHFSG